jgi:hypothetical protein
LGTIDCTENSLLQQLQPSVDAALGAPVVVKQNLQLTSLTTCCSTVEHDCSYRPEVTKTSIQSLVI